MSGRKVASLTSSLLARKGVARPAGGDATAPSPAAAPDPAAVPSVSETAASATRISNVRPDLRPYAWPTQGPPTEDDDLAVPAPPDPPAVEEPAAERHPRPMLRRLATVAIVAVAVAAAAVAFIERGDAPRQVVSEPMPSSVSTAMPLAAPEPGADAPDDAAAARSASEIAPAAGVPGAPPSADPQPPPPPVATAAPTAPRIAALPPPAAEPEPPISAAALTPPPVERPAAQSAPPASAPPPATAAAPAQRSSAAPATRPAAAGRYAVQIASLGSKARAEAESARLAKSLDAILDGRKPAVEEAMVAGRGTMYRIRVRGYATKDAADRACAAIKGNGLGCLVVRR